jgi:Protein of unknown function (DUF2975)
MPVNTGSTLNSLQRFSTWGQWVAACSGLLIVAYGIYLVLVPEEALFIMREAVPGIVVLPSTSVLIVTAVVAALPALTFLLCLFQAWKLFGLARKGQLYTAAGQALLGRLGRLAIAAASVGFVMRTVVALLLSSANPPGQKMLVIGFGSGEMTGLLVGLLVFLFAAVVRDATALAQENATFI